MTLLAYLSRTLDIEWVVALQKANGMVYMDTPFYMMALVTLFARRPVKSLHYWGRGGGESVYV